MSAIQKLSQRERRLLFACGAVVLLMGTMILLSGFLSQRRSVLAQEVELLTEKRANEAWLSDREFWEKRALWLDDSMPTTESLGRSQGQLLEELQNAALDLDIRIEQPTLLEPETTDHYREVAVSLRLWGDQQTLLRWLATLQSSKEFQLIKELDFEIDRRAEESTPHARCNLTVARWFKAEA